MRRLALLAALLAAAISPAVADGHSSNYNVTFQKEATVCDNSGPPPYPDCQYQILECGAVGAIPPGATRRYAKRDGLSVEDLPSGPQGYLGGGSRYFGIAEMVDFTHAHPMNGLDFDTGFATRQFRAPGPPTGASTQLNTRRVFNTTEVFATNDVWVKFVNLGPKYVLVSPNC